MTHGDSLFAQPVGCDGHAEAAWSLRCRAPLKPQRSLTRGLMAIAQTEKLKDGEIKMCIRWQQQAGTRTRRLVGVQ